MVFSNVLPDVVLFLGLVLGLVLGYKLGFVRVLFSGFFKRIIALVCAILLAKPIGRLIGEKFFFNGIADWIEKTLNKALDGNASGVSGEALSEELPRVVRWIVDLLHVEVQNEGTIRQISEKIATPVANVIGVVIAVVVLYIVFRIAFRLIRALLDKIMNLPVLVIVNKILGVIFGFTFAVLFLWLILSIYAARGTPASSPNSISKRRSPRNTCRALVPWISCSPSSDLNGVYSEKVRVINGNANVRAVQEADRRRLHHPHGKQSDGQRGALPPLRP